MGDKAVVDELQIKISVDTSELDGLKKFTSKFGGDLTSSMNNGLKGFNTKPLVKKVNAEAEKMADSMARSLADAFVIKDERAVSEIRKLTGKLVNEMTANFKAKKSSGSKGVDAISKEIVDSLMRNGKAIDEQSDAYRSRLKEFYDWFYSQGAIRLPKGMKLPSLEGYGVKGGKFAKQGMDLTNQNTIRERFMDLFDDTQLDNQENAIKRVLELLKEYSDVVVHTRPISSVLDGETKVWGSVISEMKGVDNVLKDQQKLLEDIKREGYEAGKSYAWEGTTKQAESALRTLGNGLADIDVKLKSGRWTFGSDNFFNAIRNMGIIEGKMDAIRNKIAQSSQTPMSFDEEFARAMSNNSTHVTDGYRYVQKVIKDIEEENQRLEEASQSRTSEEIEATRKRVVALEEERQAAKNLKKEKENRKIENAFVPTELKENKRYTEEYTNAYTKLSQKTRILIELEKKLDAVGQTRRGASSKTYQNLKIKIEEANRQIDILNARLITLQKTGKDIEDIKLDNLGNGARDTSNILTQVSAALRGMGFRRTATQVQSLGRNFKNVAVNAEGLSGAVGGIASKIPQIALVAGAILAVGKAIKTAISLFVKFAQMVGTTCAKIVKTVGRVAKSFLGLGNSTNGLSKLVKKFFMTLRNRAISKIVMGLFTQAKESLQSLAAFSNNIGSAFNKNISSLISNFKLLGNSMAAAFEPILNVVTPYLDFLMQKLVDAINVINQFFNALTGSTTWTKAIYQASNYGASVSDAASKQKELNKQLQKFDELNNISQNDGNNGSGSGSASAVNPNAFTTQQINSDVASFAQRFKEAWSKADFTDIGFDFGTSIKNALDGIKWDEIKASAEKVGKSIATFINGSLSVGGLPQALGKTVAEGINTFVSGIDSFVTNVQWINVGYFIGTSIVSAIENIEWGKVKQTAGDIGESLAKGINALLTTDVLASIGGAVGNLLATGVEGWWKFVTTFNFPKLGEKVADSINKFFENMSVKDNTGMSGWEKLGESISESLKGIVDAVKTAIEKTNWVLVGNSIRDMIEKIDFAGITWDLGSLATTIVEAIGTALKGKKVSLSDIAFDLALKGLDFNANIVSWTLLPSLNPTIDMVAKIVSYVKDGEFKSDIEGMVAKVASWNKETGFSNTIGNMIAKFVDFLLPEPFKWIVEKMTAKFSDKDDTKLDKNLDGFTANITGKQDSIVDKAINGVKAIFSTKDDSAMDKNVGNMNAQLTTKEDGIVDKAISGMKAIFGYDKDDSAMDKTVGGCVAKFSGKAEVKVDKKYKTVSGFKALINSTKSVLSGAEKTIKGMTGKVSDLDKSQVENQEVKLKGTVEPEIKMIGNEQHMVFWFKGRKRYYDSNGQMQYAKEGGIFGAGYKSIAQYAGGGIPSHGTAFIAGENGAEVVGNVGRRTEVLNQSQLAATMYSAIVNGMSQVMQEYGGNQPIYLDGKVLFDNARKRASEYYRTTGNAAFVY